MERTEKRVLTLDRYEHGVVINALNEMRNDLLEEERPTDILGTGFLRLCMRSRRFYGMFIGGGSRHFKTRAATFFRCVDGMGAGYVCATFQLSRRLRLL